MKIKDLIELLKDYDPDAEVVLQGDYCYKPLRGLEKDCYFGEVGLDYEPIFLSQYKSVDDMAVDLGGGLDEIEDFIEQLNDVVVLY